MKDTIVNQWTLLCVDTYAATATHTFALHMPLGLLIRTHTHSSSGLHVALVFIPNAEVRWHNDQCYIADRRSGAGGAAPAGNY